MNLDLEGKLGKPISRLIRLGKRLEDYPRRMRERIAPEFLAQIRLELDPVRL